MHFQATVINVPCAHDSNPSDSFCSLFLGPHLPQSLALIPEFLVWEHSLHSTLKVHHTHLQGAEYRLQITRKTDHTYFMTYSVCLGAGLSYSWGGLRSSPAGSYSLMTPISNSPLPWTSAIPSCLSDQVFCSPRIMPEARTGSLLCARTEKTGRPNWEELLILGVTYRNKISYHMAVQAL